MESRICGLLGEKLSHTFSPAIHAELADYEYRIFERREDELDAFFADACWDGINITLPYKKTVMKYCDELSDGARAIGSINTIVRREDGTLYGDNTDAYGFGLLLDRLDSPVEGKKCLILGSGGASVAIRYVLGIRSAGEIVTISRTGDDNYHNLERHYDADIIINATPVGMYPDTDQAPLDLEPFGRLSAVIDIIYNPARTNLMMQAEELGIQTIGGMEMLVGQAARSSEQFAGITVSDSKIQEVARMMQHKSMNIAIIGMPGAGKTTITHALGAELGIPSHDCDDLVLEMTGRTPAEIITEDGEAAFRICETRALKEYGNYTGIVLGTGGGCVTIPENYKHLHRNSIIIWVKRNLELLPTEGRPLSKAGSLEALYAKRRPMYEKFSDVSIENNGSVEGAIAQIKEILCIKNSKGSIMNSK